MRYYGVPVQTKIQANTLLLQGNELSASNIIKAVKKQRRYINLEKETKEYLKACEAKSIVNQTNIKTLNDFVINRKTRNLNTTFLANSPIVLNGLVLWFDAGVSDSYPAGGTVWRDLASSNNGTLTNGPTFSSGNGGSILFDGSDDFVLAGPIPFTGTSTVSVSWGIWVKPSSTAGNIMSMSSTNPQGGWNMPPIAASGQKFRGKIWSNNYLFSTSTYTLNTWYYVVLVFDYSAGAQRFYVNGVLQDSQTGISYSSSGSNNYIFLGQSNPGADNTGMFAGNISNFHIYGNKALTPTEILQNYNAMKGRFGL